MRCVIGPLVPLFELMFEMFKLFGVSGHIKHYIIFWGYINFVSILKVSLGLIQFLNHI